MLADLNERLEEEARRLARPPDSSRSGATGVDERRAAGAALKAAHPRIAVWPRRGQSSEFDGEAAIITL